MVGCLPVLYWLPRYSFWDYGMPDLISGISVGIMHLPQGKSFSILRLLYPCVEQEKGQNVRATVKSNKSLIQ